MAATAKVKAASQAQAARAFEQAVKAFRAASTETDVRAAVAS